MPVAYIFAPMLNLMTRSAKLQCSLPACALLGAGDRAGHPRFIAAHQRGSLHMGPRDRDIGSWQRQVARRQQEPAFAVRADPQQAVRRAYPPGGGAARSAAGQEVERGRPGLLIPSGRPRLKRVRDRRERLDGPDQFAEQDQTATPAQETWRFQSWFAVLANVQP